VAERSDKTPVCIVYNIETLKRKVITSDDIKQRELVSVAFSPSNEKMLVTLTENLHDQQRVFIWQWDKTKCIAEQQI
jgi:WD40 repeat protein